MRLQAYVGRWEGLHQRGDEGSDMWREVGMVVATGGKVYGREGGREGGRGEREGEGEEAGEGKMIIGFGEEVHEGVGEGAGIGAEGGGSYEAGRPKALLAIGLAEIPAGKGRARRSAKASLTCVHVGDLGSRRWVLAMKRGALCRLRHGDQHREAGARPEKPESRHYGRTSPPKAWPMPATPVGLADCAMRPPSRFVLARHLQPTTVMRPPTRSWAERAHVPAVRRSGAGAGGKQRTLVRCPRGESGMGSDPRRKALTRVHQGADSDACHHNIHAPERDQGHLVLFSWPRKPGESSAVELPSLASHTRRAAPSKTKKGGVPLTFIAREGGPAPSAHLLTRLKSGVAGRIGELSLMRGAPPPL